MLYLVLLYIVSYAYWWFIITIGTVFLGGAYVSTGAAGLHGVRKPHP